MRTAVTQGGLLVAVVSLLTAVAFTLTPTPTAATVVVLDLVQAIWAIAVVLAVRGPLRRVPVPVAFVFLSGVIAVPLGSLAVDPMQVTLIAASLALVPVAVALTIPFEPKWYVAWAGLLSLTVGAAAVWFVRVGAVPVGQDVQLIAAVTIGVAFGITGQRLRYRSDRRAFDREALLRSLVARSRRQEQALSELNDALAESARTDPLTGAGNRLRLQEDLVVLEDRVRRYGQSLALAMVDVDRFKQFNDRHGHLAGDAALRLVVRAIRAASRPGDLLYRYGGEEFILTLPEQGAEGAFAAVERLRLAVHSAAVAAAVDPPGTSLTVSCGIAVVAAGSTEDGQSWIRRADSALYAAKGAGRDRSVVADDPTGTPGEA